MEPGGRFRVLELAGTEHHKSEGEAMVARFLHEMLLFSCVFAFVMGIVIAGASLLG